MPSNIRLAEGGDRAAIEGIVAVAYGKYVPRIGRKPGPMLDDYGAAIASGSAYVLEHDGIVAGVLVLKPEPDAMLLDNVAVSPSHQGHGFGRVLLDFADQKARDAGLATIRLYTHELMVENQALYARLGFVETHRAEDQGLRRVFMSKSLAGGSDHRPVTQGS